MCEYGAQKCCSCRNLWLSDVCYGASRFSVRTKSAEHVLKQLRNDPTWLDGICKDEQGTLFLQGADCSEQPAVEEESQAKAVKRKQDAEVQEADAKKVELRCAASLMLSPSI